MPGVLESPFLFYVWVKVVVEDSFYEELVLPPRGRLLLQRRRLFA